MTAPGLAAKLGARALHTRWVVRAPIALYRARLGFLFGSRMLMLQHTGRRSGAQRYVVLEVVDHPAPDQYVVVSGFGVGAQWYRNIAADPRVHLSIGTRNGVTATATPMTEAESADTLQRYIHQHPKAWSRLRGTIEQATGTPVDTLPMVRLSIGS
ncbi:nitroreductase family deazaflavin-dependent oxidoreductase [Nocardia sp. NBC_01327]|uniref:nitroreductase family deazaflavin-dependent oxidoreductase n=1 Tax=Nocardia sp. NBC_01327 TaxID=2903593 RepID=UPI002E120ED5|nr:nitroreductase family deazaflavin-dependent oxidoreductase [Nocardia sp. NBC_01327]